MTTITDISKLERRNYKQVAAWRLSPQAEPVPTVGELAEQYGGDSRCGIVECIDGWYLVVWQRKPRRCSRKVRP